MSASALTVYSEGVFFQRILEVFCNDRTENRADSTVYTVHLDGFTVLFAVFSAFAKRGSKMDSSMVFSSSKL